MDSPVKNWKRAMVACAGAAVICTGALLVLGSNDAEARGRGKHRSCDVSYKAAFEELYVAIDRIDRVNRSDRSSKSKRNKINKIIARANSRLESGIPDQPLMSDRHHRRQVPVMDRENLATLVAMVDDAFSDDSKINQIELGTRYSSLRVDQVISLVNTVAFESNKVKVARMLRPLVVDPEHWYQVCSAFSFNGSCEKISR